MKTTIQLSEVLRKKLKILAASRDLSYEEFFHDLIDAFEANIPFKSEEQFAEWFEDNLDKFGFRKIIKKRKNSFPDYLIEDIHGKKMNVELEMTPKDFERHKHDPKKVDMIITVYSTQKKFKGIPILSLIESEDMKNRVLKTKKTTIKIPRKLYNNVSTMIKNTGFSSVTDFIVFVMRNIVSSCDFDKNGNLTDKEIKLIRKRLKTLGYI